MEDDLFINSGKNLIDTDDKRRERFATMSREVLKDRWNTPFGNNILLKWKNSKFNRETIDLLVGKFDNHLDLRGIPLKKESLVSVDLSDTDLFYADLEESDFSYADLTNSYLSEANIRGTRFDWAKMDKVYLDNVCYDNKTSFLGINLSTINFNLAVLLRDLALTQQRIKHLEKSNPLLAAFLRITSEYSLSISRFFMWVMGILLFFTAAYAFIPGTITKTGLVNAFYFSVVTFTTLGYGDITPASLLGQILVIIEVCLGYIMGGLFVTILARRLLLG
ncbi:MAG TPA: pentapeptide repeat-containing protein [Thermodesulfovibrionia bacterium]|nr:pentapeptide repeat-containing protein [Thermodesulfovibrionia bacterium]